MITHLISIFSDTIWCGRVVFKLLGNRERQELWGKNMAEQKWTHSRTGGRSVHWLKALEKQFAHFNQNYNAQVCLGDSVG